MLTGEIWWQRIQTVLRDASLPVEASRTWATRNSSVSQGTSGIVLALAELANHPSPTVVAPARSFDLYSAAVDWDKKSGQLTISSTPSETSAVVLGDVFSGYCSYIWTDIVLGRALQRRNYLPGDGTVVRPGVAHGELIRDLIRWLELAKGNQGAFESADEVFDDGGWCYGQAGLAAVLAIAHQAGSITEADEAVLRGMPDRLIAAAIHQKDSSEVGLCHGIAGMLVSAIGVARFFQDDQAIAKVQSTFRAVLDDDTMINIHRDLQVDASWLTGIAGVLWAEQVMHRPPIINPLFPLDAQVHIQAEAR